MKLYEWAASRNPQWLLTNIQVVDMCLEVAKKAEALECSNLVDTYINIADFFTNALNDEAKENPTSGVFTVINKVPKTINQIMAESELTDRKAVLAELKKLIKDGLVVKPTQQTYARYDAQTEDSGSAVEADG